MQVAVEHDSLASKTVLGVQRPARDSGAKSSLVVLFDGLPMIEAGVPQALSSAQLSGDLPPVTALYVESIEGAAKRGPSRRASLTQPDILQRFIDEATTFIARHTNVYVDPSRRIVVGHSLGVIAALYVAAKRPRFSRHVLALSAALWWPGEPGELSGQAAIDRALRRDAMRVWMTTGAAEEEKLLSSNDAFYERLVAANRHVVRTQHLGGHEPRPADIVNGLMHLLQTDKRSGSTGGKPEPSRA
jgi:enterochelin esterase-like enzyme